MTPELMTFDGRHEHSWEYEGFDDPSSFEPYSIQVTNPKLSIYDSPSYSGNIVGEITDKSKYTIVEEYIEPGQTSIGSQSIFVHCLYCSVGTKHSRNNHRRCFGIFRWKG